MLKLRFTDHSVELSGASLRERLEQLGYSSETAHGLSVSLEGLREALGEGDSVNRTLQSLLPAAVRRTIGQLPVEPGGDALRFMVPPRALRRRTPSRVGHRTLPLFDTYLELGDEQARALASHSNAILQELHAAGYAPAVEGNAAARAYGARLAVLAKASRALCLAAKDRRFAEALCPGELPIPIRVAVEQFASSFSLRDMFNPVRLREFGAEIGATEGAPDVPGILSLAPAYALFRRDYIQRVGRPAAWRRWLAGDELGWWLDGQRLLDRLKEHSSTVERPPEHVVVLGPGAWVEGEEEEPEDEDGPETITEPPERLWPPERPGPSPMIVYSVSDLHLGQGTLAGEIDNADEVYPELTTAYAEMIRAWGAAVDAYRASPERRGAPAYLVLNGDILDLWAADLTERPAAGGGFEIAPAYTLEAHPIIAGQEQAKITAADVHARVDRIVAAHAEFVDAVTTWVDMSPNNFCLYVGGNHDDLLARTGTGAYAAAKFHPSRALFSGKTVWFPAIQTLFEHGHRGDTDNTPSQLGAGRLGPSPGELLVSMVVNPLERGGTSVVRALLGAMTLPIDFPLQGDEAAAMGRALDQLVAARAVDPAIYDAWMRTIDEIDNQGHAEAAADLCGQALYFAAPDAAKAAAVADLDEAGRALLALWADEYTSDLTWLAVQLGLLDLIHPAHLDAVLRGPSSVERLGFNNRTGIGSSGAFKVHCVGHTHRPEETTPPLSGRLVLAQHVNTGTGQDMYKADDTWGADTTYEASSTGIRWVTDSLTPRSAAMGCLIEVIEIRGHPRLSVRGVNYRSLQGQPGTPRLVVGGFHVGVHIAANEVLLD